MHKFTKGAISNGFSVAVNELWSKDPAANEVRTFMTHLTSIWRTIDAQGLPHEINTTNTAVCFYAHQVVQEKKTPYVEKFVKAIQTFWGEGYKNAPYEEIYDLLLLEFAEAYANMFVELCKLLPKLATHHNVKKQAKWNSENLKDFLNAILDTRSGEYRNDEKEYVIVRMPAIDGKVVEFMSVTEPSKEILRVEVVLNNFPMMWTLDPDDRGMSIHLAMFHVNRNKKEK